MNDKDTLEFEDRYYISPTVSRDEQLDFIDNYRNVLNSNVQRINTETHNLGTDVPSNLGGLSGAGATFESRYITPQANTAVAELKAKAQDTALTQALKNLEAQMNQRYKNAYRNARITEYNNNKNSGGGADDLGLDTNPDDNSKTEISTDKKYLAGKLYPAEGSNYVMDYLDANGQWWQLMASREFDNLVNGGISITPRNESTKTQNGVTYMYLDNDQLEQPTWYRATMSAGPGTYSPYAGG